MKRDDFIQSIQLTDAPLCIKLRIEKKAYLQEFNEALSEIKHNGTLDRIFKRSSVEDN